MLTIIVRAGLFLAVALLLVPSTATAAVSVSRAELSGGQVRVEGRGAVANATVTVRSPESTASGRADGSGNFRVEASSFRSSTCRVTVSDGPTSATATLSGCTPTSTTPPPPPPPPPDDGTTPPPPPPPPPPSGCQIQDQTEPFAIPAGDLTTFFWSIAQNTGCRTSNAGMQWSLVAGRIPPGMTGPHLQGVGSGFVTGRPTTVGTYQFTIRGRDNNGQTDTAVFTINVIAARPVTITTESFFSVAPGPRVGESPCCWNLFSSGGTPGYTYSVVAGALPTGTSIIRFSNGTRISGTLRAAGTFTFSLVSTDSRGSRSAPKQFTIVVQPSA